ncbi:MAG: TIGR00282 family metallophosphoesterase [bacterium]|nr:MAG: TIGR00282 family metallophosphoesterase [bacterium]
MRVLFIGDVVGKPGRRAVRDILDGLVDRHKVDLVVANAENAAGGFGVTSETAAELFEAGVHVLTTGNHVWDKREALELVETEPRILRPANYPPGAPGQGQITVRTPVGVSVTVVNLSGRVFMDTVDCPFRRMDAILEELGGKQRCIVVDLHAEATSEKRALALYLDGRVSGVLGTHTHIQTADERILPGGTAYITDVGMTGNEEGSVIGIDFEAARYRFLTQMPVRFDLSKGVPVLNGVLLEMDVASGKAVAIKRISQSLGRSVSP